GRSRAGSGVEVFPQSGAEAKPASVLNRVVVARLGLPDRRPGLPLDRHPGQTPWPRPVTGTLPGAGSRSERERGTAEPTLESSRVGHSVTRRRPKGLPRHSPHARSLDHLIGAGEKRQRYRQPQRLRSLHVDDEFEFYTCWTGRSAGLAPL